MALELEVEVMRQVVLIEVVKENRWNADPFGCLKVNSKHIWRFDNVEGARLAALNLRKALDFLDVNFDTKV